MEIGDELVRHAGDLAETAALRGYDAVHLAAAQLVGEADLAFVSGDRVLLTAASSAGLHVAPIG